MWSKALRRTDRPGNGIVEPHKRKRPFNNDTEEQSKESSRAEKKTDPACWLRAGLSRSSRHGSASIYGCCQARARLHARVLSAPF